jgi:hypothetical protein
MLEKKLLALMVVEPIVPIISELNSAVIVIAAKTIGLEVPTALGLIRRKESSERIAMRNAYPMKINPSGIARKAVVKILNKAIL